MNTTSLSSIFSELSKLDDDSYPPVENWNPPLCENVSMKIDRSGKWYFMNSPIGRERMVKLFSRVLRKDEDGYYLVTPVEKIKIEVELRPFIIVDYEILGESREQKIIFKTNTEEIFEVNEEHPIKIEKNINNEEPIPTVLVRKNLEGLLSRNVYYSLIEHSILKEGEYGIYSAGSFYELS